MDTTGNIMVDIADGIGMVSKVGRTQQLFGKPLLQLFLYNINIQRNRGPGTVYFLTSHCIDSSFTHTPACDVSCVRVSRLWSTGWTPTASPPPHHHQQQLILVHRHHHRSLLHLLQHLHLLLRTPGPSPRCSARRGSVTPTIQPG